MTAELRKPKVFHVEGVRPTTFEINDPLWIEVLLPEDILIFNAPRPLVSSAIVYTFTRSWKDSDGNEKCEEKNIYCYPYWEGDFYHGIHYAGVMPDDTRSINANISLDGWVLVYHTEEDPDFKEWMQNKEIEYPGFKETIDPENAFGQWLDELNNGEQS